MRRTIALLLALAICLILLPGPVASARTRCTIDVTPATGGPTDVYRIQASNFPLTTDGTPLEVRIDIRRLGTREGSIILVWVVPGVRDFYVDYNVFEPGEGAVPLAPGRYLVVAETSHQRGCHTTDRFVVR